MSPWSFLERLAGSLPHRGATTDHEKRAAAILSDLLVGLGYEVELQPFRAPRDTLYAGPLTVGGAMIIVAALSWWLSGPRWVPGAGCALCLALLLPLIGELRGRRPNFDLVLPRHASQNVVGRTIADVEASDASTGGPRIVLCAHYDTQRGSFLFSPRWLPWLRAYFALAYLSFASLPVGLSAMMAWPGSAWPEFVVGAGMALSSLVLAVLFWAWRTGQYVPGANDNGSGCAVVLALAARLARQPLPVPVTVLFTGAEETGLRGMMDWFSRLTRQERAQVHVINLDNVGGGTLHFLTGEGLPPVPYGPLLVDEARRLAQELEPGSLVEGGTLLLPTDGLAVAAAGGAAITFIGLDEQGRIPHYHWHTDTVDKLSPSHLAAVEAVVWAYVQRVAERLAVGITPPRG